MTIKLNVFTIVAADPANGIVVPVGINLSQEAAEANLAGLFSALTVRSELADSLRIVPAVLLYDESSLHG